MKPQLTELELMCFDLLDFIKKENEAFHKINCQLSKHSDFIGVINCTDKMQAKTVRLIDVILDDGELGSYWLYEITKRGKHIKVLSGKEYEIFTIKQLKNYYLKECK